jgi:hypothetical protein
VSNGDPQPILIDVLDPRLAGPVVGGELRILVEPTWGCVAVCAALDAGWHEVELASDELDAAPIPLVSFEQRPPDGAVRCRVRSSDLADAAHGGELLGAPVIARPLAAMLAARIEERVTFVPAPCGERVAADAMWAVGMLIRVLLDELDDRSSTLTDAAGIAVTIALGAEDAATRLSTGARWARHLKRGGHPDDLRVAAAVDSIGVVPMLARDGDALVARVWH